MDYEQMLNRARDKLPEDLSSGERFTVDKVKGHLQGNKTVISNLGQIATQLGRPKELLVKFIEKQLATKGIIKGNFVIFNTKLSANKINERVQQFTDQFVICKECGKPDTKLSKDTGVYFIKCQACGAKYSVKTRF
ncbi:MAG: translation initiation factor IF-2 subunit beta [Candidatus Woesearchaeota archaeon]